MVIMVAHTRAGRKGLSTMKHETMSMPKSSMPNAIRPNPLFLYS